MAGFQLGTPAFLIGGHSSFASQFAVGVIKDVASIDLYGNVVMERKVLTELKTLETIDDNLPGKCDSTEITVLKEQTVPSKAGDMVSHG